MNTSGIGWINVLAIAGGIVLLVNGCASTPGEEYDLLSDIGTSVELADGISMEFVYIPAGTFIMGLDDGAPEEVPARKVKIKKPFLMGKYEVTQEQYDAIMGGNRCEFKGAKLPVITVFWTQALKFCEKLSEQQDQAGRLSVKYEFTLPTEAQWEYACRAGATEFDPEMLDETDWYVENSGKRPHPVGQKKPNAWGLYDMYGNVSEWCADDWYDNHEGAPSDETVRKSLSLDPERVYRGGSWSYAAELCRPTFRFRYYPTFTLDNLGFRVCVVCVDD